MAHLIKFKRSAEKEIDKLPQYDYRRVLQAITALADEPRPRGCIKLRGRDGYRIRVGVYRIIYDIFDDVLIIHIVSVGHRKDIYD